MDDLIAKAPCSGLLPVQHGAMEMVEIDVGAIFSIAPFKGQRVAVSDLLSKTHGVTFADPNCVVSAGDITCAWSGREQVFLLGEAPDPGLADLAAVTDQTDAWAVVQLTGDGFADALARLVPVDMRSSHFGPDQCVRTLLGHMSVLIMTVPGGVRIMAFRSMAHTLVHEVSQAMALVDARTR